MSLTVDDTIAAIASPSGPALRGVVRLSGPDVRAVMGTLFRPTDANAWHEAKRPTRHAGRLALDDLPRGLPCDVFLWPTSGSYTGQPSAEIHMVGSPPLLDAVLAFVIEAGARPAGRGEFTLRAFLAGRLDLTQAEAVLGVIDAEDSATLTVALDQLDGGLSGPLAELHERLLIDLADLEAGLDFADEDLDFVSREQFSARLSDAGQEIDRLLSQQVDRGRSQSTDTVVLTGPPNAGKSTLLNALSTRDAAIVSDVAGTTRDAIEVEVSLAGRRFRLIDTAGTDDGDDPLVRAAEEQRRERAAGASLVLYCSPVDEPLDEMELRRLATERPVILVRTKSDQIATNPTNTTFPTPHSPSPDSLSDAILSVVAKRCVNVSAQANDGLPTLLNVIAATLDADAGERSQLLATTSARCRGSLAVARERLNAALDLLRHEAGDELVAGELRDGLGALAAVLGRVYTDDILDRVFSRFCIGK